MDKKECDGVTDNIEVSYLNTELIENMKNSHYMEKGLKPNDWKIDRFEYDKEKKVKSVIFKPVFDFDKALKNLKTSRSK